MSYILDALKKSEQERQQGNAPHVHSVHGSPPPATNFSPFTQHIGLWMFVGGTFFFGIGIGILFFLYRQNPVVKEAMTAGKTPPAAVVMQRSAPAPKIIYKTSPEVSGPIPAADEVVQEEVSIPGMVIVKNNDIIVRSIEVEETTSPPPEVITPKAAQKSLPLLEELPADVQAEVPKLKFAGHTYAKTPAQRMIIINGQILREGDVIASGTRLMEITWEGVVIDFKGARFLVKIN